MLRLRQVLSRCRYDPLFQSSNAAPVGADVRLSRHQHAYLRDCKRCEKAPTGQQNFATCQRCKRVRYCCKECQRADWPEHKVVCGKRSAPWWGRAPVARRGGQSAA